MAIEKGMGSDGFGIRITEHVTHPFKEEASHHTSFRIDEWDLDQISYARKRNDRHLIFDPRIEPRVQHFRKFNVRPADTRVFEDQNLITAAGWARALNSGGFLGAAGTLFSTTVGRVGMGQVVAGTAMTYADVALGAATGWTGGNWQLCGVAPVYTAASGGTGATLVFSCTFTTAAFSTNPITEFAVDQGTAASAANTTASIAPMINHGIIASGSYGTKTSAQTWNTTVTITLT